MQNAVIYARYSSHGQNEQTIEGQVRVCREYAATSKYNVVGVYVDKHKTGTDDNRPQFQKMIGDAATGAFNYVIVYMLDRFARSRYYSTIYNWQLMQNNVKLLSATENISESEEGEFYQMFLEWNAEKYSKRLSKRVKEGLTTSVEHGNFTGGHLMYGYKVNPIQISDKEVIKKVAIDEDTAGVVKYIFERYSKGTTKKEIADELNKKGLRYNGKPFKAKMFDRILTSPKYTGAYFYGGRLCDKTYPQIIDPIMFDTVQARLQKNKYFSGANSAKIPYLLQGKIYCGHCGASMVSGGGTGKLGTKYYYYACTGRTKKRTCTKTNEKKDFLEWYATERVVKYLSDPRRVDIIATDVVNYYESRTSNTEIRRVAVEKLKTQKEIDNAVNLLISGVSAEVIKTLDKKIVELTALLNDLTEQQGKLELEQGLKVTKPDIVAFVAEFIKGDLHDKDFQKRIIDNLVNAMYIYDDKVVLYFNIKGGSVTAFIGKEDTDEAIAEHGANGCAGVQTLSRLLRQ